MSRSIALGVTLLGLLTAHAGANPIAVRPPAQKNPAPTTSAAQDTKLVVEMSPSVTKPRLEIPAPLLAQLQGTSSKLGWLGEVNTTVAGFALAGAFVTGGLWLTRRAGKKIAALAVLFVLTSGSLLWADIPLARGPRPIKLPSTVRLQEDVTLAIVPKGDKIKLILPSMPQPRKSDS